MVAIEASKPKPFKIDIPKSEVDRAIQLAKLVDLKPWLETLPDVSEEQNDYDFSNDFGIKSGRVTSMVKRLTSGFDWYEWQSKFNAMGEHGIVTVKGIEDEPSLDVHFVRVDSDSPTATNALLVHGWPGSFCEFYKMVPLLKKKYNLLIPSIPGYTFSQAPKKGQAFTLEKAAHALNAVTEAHGWKKYVAQDRPSIARLYPDRCVGVHVNLLVGPPAGEEAEFSAEDKRWKERNDTFQTRGTAYQYMHYSTPFTIGAMLTSSPVAALAYIGEKFYRWSAPPYVNEDEVIANTLMYWFTGHTTSSVWLYYAVLYKGHWIPDGKTPLIAFGGGKDDIFSNNRKGLEDTADKVVSHRYLERGGHFLALEEPELLTNDFDEFVNSKEVQAALAK